MIFNVIKRLLPLGRAFDIINDKYLRRFFEGIGVALDSLCTFIDDIYDDIWPQSTRELDAWDILTGQVNSPITDQERRDRLANWWTSTGGQSPRYIQDVLQGAGFDVYVYDWWSSLNPTVVRDPTTILDGAPGYPLVNRILASNIGVITAGTNSAVKCGRASSVCGGIVPIGAAEPVYTIPTDPDKWRYFWYISSSSFGTPATIDADRKNEFETLVLKVAPAHMWCGVIVNFV